MSGSYVNAAEAAEAAANASSSRAPSRPSRRGGSGVTPSHSPSSTLGSSTLISSANQSATAAAAANQHRVTRRTSSRTVVQQRRHHQNHQQQHQQQHQRPRSVVSQRFSQVYDMAVDGRPAFLHRAAVTPALWLLCQTVLVVLFALCCAFLVNRPVDSRDSQPWIRLEFAQGKDKPKIYNTTANKPYGELICSKSAGELSNNQHCEDMKQHFELRTTSGDGTAIIIKRGAVYRINAAVTFHTATAGIFRNVDVSVQINNETWISCQEGMTGNYVHCSLFGMQYLPMGSVVTFSSSMSGWRIASHSGVTFFDIEMRF